MDEIDTIKQWLTQANEINSLMKKSAIITIKISENIRYYQKIYPAWRFLQINKLSIESTNKTPSKTLQLPKRTIKANSLRNENTKDAFTNEIASPNRFEVLSSISDDRDNFLSERHAFGNNIIISTNNLDKSVRLHNSNTRTIGLHKSSKLKSKTVGFVQKKIVP